MTKDAEKERENRKLLFELMSLGDTLTATATLVRHIDNDNGKDTGKMDTDLLRKAVLQMRVMGEMAKEVSATLLDLDASAYKN